MGPDALAGAWIFACGPADGLLGMVRREHKLQGCCCSQWRCRAQTGDFLLMSGYHEINSTQTELGTWNDAPAGVCKGACKPAVGPQILGNA